MKRLLGFDTETTGLIDFKKELADESQPRITQLAAILVEENGDVVDEMSVYIKPDGWEVPEYITQRFGVTTEQLERDGIPMVEAMQRFNELKAGCTHRIAHNASFDKMMLRREAFAYDLPHDSSGIETICTMKMCREILKEAPTDRMLAAGIKGNKMPKLEECYRFFFGKELEGAHNAYTDAKAVLEVYYAAKKFQAAQGAA